MIQGASAPFVINRCMNISFTDIFLTNDNDELAVSLREMKEHLNISDYDGDDTLIRSYIQSAQAFFEGPEGFGFVLMKKTYEVELDYLPSNISINLTPIQSFNVTQGGVAVEPHKSSIRRGMFSYQSNSLPALITIVAGYDDADDIPTDIKQMIKLLVGDWYRNRENTQEYNYKSMPIAFDAILNKYRRY